MAMMTTNYRRGRDMEYRVRDYYRDKGYTAIRTAGSHSPVDVIAWNKKEVVLAQVKRTRADKQVLPDQTFKDMQVPFAQACAFEHLGLVRKELWNWYGKGITLTYTVIEVP